MKGMLIALLTLVLLNACTYLQQDDAQSKEPGSPSHRTMALRNEVYQRLTAIQSFVENKEYIQAKTSLDNLLSEKVGGKEFNSYELGIIYNMYAYVYSNMNQYDDAIAAYKAILNLPPEVSPSIRGQALRQLSNLYAVIGRSQESEAALRSWIEFTLDHGYVSEWELSKAYLALGERDSAKIHFTQGINNIRVHSSKQTIPQVTYELLGQLYGDDPGSTEDFITQLETITPDIDHTLLLTHFSGKPSPESIALVSDLYDRYLPIIKVAPIYPQKALEDKVEGYCEISYTVLKTGSVGDLRVMECSPEGYFEEASLAATQKFKYKPRVEKGDPVDTPGVSNRFTFELEKEPEQSK